MAWKLWELICSCVIIYGLTGTYAEVLKCGDDPCRCSVSEEKFFNFSDLKANLTSGNLAYYFYGCRNVNDNVCGNTTLCLQEIANNTTSRTNLGNQQSMSVEPSEIGTGYDIIYNFNKHQSRIGLVCTENFTGTYLISKNISNIKSPILYIFSKNACLQSIPPPRGMSTGGTLIVLILVGFIVYFAGGAIVLYCIRGARGREMIPNIDFWENLPGLVKDGMIFVLNGCRPAAVPTAESYDRI